MRSWDQIKHYPSLIVCLSGGNIKVRQPWQQDQQQTHFPGKICWGSAPADGFWDSPFSSTDSPIKAQLNPDYFPSESQKSSHVQKHESVKELLEVSCWCLGWISSVFAWGGVSPHRHSWQLGKIQKWCKSLKRRQPLCCKSLRADFEFKVCRTGSLIRFSFRFSCFWCVETSRQDSCGACLRLKWGERRFSFWRWNYRNESVWWEMI